MKTAICIYCKTRHTNKNFPDDTLSDTCLNCTFIVKMLRECVEGINRWTPITTGKCNRKLTIIDFKIEKI